jgi:hypothetical protein
MTKDVWQIANSATTADWEVAKLKIDTLKWLAEQQTPTSPQATVNKQYWLESAEKLVANASTGKIDAAAKVQSMLGWIWTAYTAGVALVIGLAAGTLNNLATILIVIPIPVLLIAYWISIYAQMPIPLTFDPRLWEQIKDEYLRANRGRTRRLRWSLTVAFIGAAIVCIGLVAVSLTPRLSGGEYSLLLERHTENKQITVVARAKVPETYAATLRIRDDSTDTIMKEMKILPPHDGRIDLELAVSDWSNLRAEIAWTTDAGVRHLISRKFAE